MILSDKRILEEIGKGTIKIEPYSRVCLGSNSYDVHLGKCLATYREHILDAKKHNEIEYFEIPDEGFVDAVITPEPESKDQTPVPTVGFVAVKVAEAAHTV